MAAVSQRDAWAGGLANSAGSHAFLQHWDGRTWSRVSLPAAVRKISYGQISGLAASSASNVWAFISGHPAAVARFDGTRWQVMREWPGEDFSITGEAFSPRDVWMFGGIGPRTAGTWHYNGHRWRRPKMPLTAFDVSRTAVSQHLTVLKNAGLLDERRDGTRRLYRARPEGLAELRHFLNDIWASSLDVARRLVEAERGISDDDHAARAG